MAVAGQVIENPTTGERLTFVEVAADTGGERLVMKAVWPRPGQRAFEHIHPGMAEHYEVLAGRARIRDAGAVAALLREFPAEIAVP